MSSATVWNSRTTSPAVWGPSANCSRLDIQLHWRLCSTMSVALSNLNETYHSPVKIGCRAWRQGTTVSKRINRTQTSYHAKCRVKFKGRKLRLPDASERGELRRIPIQIPPRLICVIFWGNSECVQPTQVRIQLMGGLRRSLLEGGRMWKV